MPIIIPTLIFVVIILLGFVLLSRSKKEDYLLDDYTEEDAPDNVRIITKEKEIVDKEKEKELEKTVSELTNAKSISDTKIGELESSLSKSLSEIDSLKNELSRNNVEISELRSINSSALSENAELLKANSTYDKGIRKLEQKNSDLEKKVDKHKHTLLSKDEDISILNDRIDDLTKDNKKLQSQINMHKKDVDFFMAAKSENLDKINELERLLSEAYTINDNVNIISGVDTNGHFYNINNINFDKKTNEYIRNIHRELEQDQVGYCVYTTNTNSFNQKIGDISNLENFLLDFRSSLDPSKYKRYLIVGDKVYVSI